MTNTTQPTQLATPQSRRAPLSSYAPTAAPKERSADAYVPAAVPATKTSETKAPANPTGLLSGLQRALMPQRSAAAALDPAKVALQKATELYEAAATASCDAGAQETIQAVAAWSRLVTHCNALNVDLVKVLNQKFNGDYPLHILVQVRHIDSLVALSRGLYARMQADAMQGLTLKKGAVERVLLLAGQGFKFTLPFAAAPGSSITKLVATRGAWPRFCLGVNHVALAEPVQPSWMQLPLTYWHANIAPEGAEKSPFSAGGHGFSLEGIWTAGGINNARVQFDAWANGPAASFQGKLYGRNMLYYIGCGEVDAPGRGVALVSSLCVGQVVYEDGGWYQGYYETRAASALPLPDGWGQMMRPTSNTSGCEFYVGHFRAGRPDGQGFFAADYESLYVGKWRGGMRHGLGKNQEPGGKLIEGNFCDDLPSGACCVSQTSEPVSAEALARIVGKAQAVDMLQKTSREFDVRITDMLASLEEIWPRCAEDARYAFFANGEEDAARGTAIRSNDSAAPPSHHATPLAAAAERVCALEKALESSNEALNAARVQIKSLEDKVRRSTTRHKYSSYY